MHRVWYIFQSCPKWTAQGSMQRWWLQRSLRLGSCGLIVLFILFSLSRLNLYGFQTVTERREYQCLVDTQHPCLCSDSPNGTECHPSHWERNRCLHRGHQRWSGPRVASPTYLAGWELWGRELNGCQGTVVFDLSKS